MLEKAKFDYSKLRDLIKVKCRTETAFAPLVDISTVSLSAKLNNNVGFTGSEIQKIMKLLGIKRTESSYYFFDEVVRKT